MQNPLFSGPKSLPNISPTVFEAQNAKLPPIICPLPLPAKINPPGQGLLLEYYGIDGQFLHFHCTTLSRIIACYGYL